MTPKSNDDPKLTIVLPCGRNFRLRSIRSSLSRLAGQRLQIILVGDHLAIHRRSIRWNGDTFQLVTLPDMVSVKSEIKSKYIVYCSESAKVSGDGWGVLLRTMEENEDFGLIGCKVQETNTKLVSAGGILWRNGARTDYGKGASPNDSNFNYVKEVDFVHPSCFIMRTTIWKELAAESHLNSNQYYGDVELAFMVRTLGFKVVYQPAATVYFKGTMANGGLRPEFLSKWNKSIRQDHFLENQHLFWARDRSHRKKTILIVYEHELAFDKSTASRMIYHYVKAFLSMGLHVIFVSETFEDTQPYTMKLEQIGVQVLYGQWFKKNLKNWIRDHSHYLDYVYLVYPFIAMNYVDFLKSNTRAKIIYNASDLFYLRDKRNYEVTKDPQLLESSEWWRQVEFELFSKVDVTHLVSSFEKKILKQSFPNRAIRHIPVYIYETPRRTEIPTPFDQREGILFVGQFGHKPNPDGVLWFVRRIFPLIIERIPQAKLFLIGLNPPEEIVSLQSDQVILAGHVSDSRLEAYYQCSKVVIAPLRFGAGVKGKVVEAMYHQVPVVTTSIGAEGLPKINGIIKIADDEIKFAEEVISLYTSQDEWEKLSSKSHKYIQRHFSLQAVLKQLQKDIQS